MLSRLGPRLSLGLRALELCKLGRSVDRERSMLAGLRSMRDGARSTRSARVCSARLSIRWVVVVRWVVAVRWVSVRFVSTRLAPRRSVPYRRWSCCCAGSEGRAAVLSVVRGGGRGVVRSILVGEIRSARFAVPSVDGRLLVAGRLLGTRSFKRARTSSARVLACVLGWVVRKVLPIPPARSVLC